MNFVLPIQKFNSAYVYFCEPIRNNVMNEGNFLRLLYTTPTFTLNGILIQLPFKVGVDFVLEQSNHNHNFSYCVGLHPFVSNQLDDIQRLEEQLLQLASLLFSSKIPHYRIISQLKGTSPIKVLHEKPPCHEENVTTEPVLLLKISGVWETTTMYGLTYKFVTGIKPVR